MPKPSTSRVPSYRCHKPTGQAVVTINGRDIYLGKWNSAESKAEFGLKVATLPPADALLVPRLTQCQKLASMILRLEHQNLVKRRRMDFLSSSCQSSEAKTSSNVQAAFVAQRAKI